MQILFIKYGPHSEELPIKLFSLEQFRSELAVLVQGGVISDQERKRADHKAQLALGLIPDDTDRGEYLGTDQHGYQYYARPDLYVYQYSPVGAFVGWIAHITAWDNAISKILDSEVIA